MNTKVRALLWEEFRVGGAIVAVCFACGLLGLLSCWIHLHLALRGAKNGAEWAWILNGYLHDYQFILRLFTAGIPFFTGLMLIFGLGNSGHLAGGFSRRILRLPVPTRTVVTVSLFTRLSGVLLQAAALFTVSHMLGFESPPWRIVFLLGMFYLVIQLVDWLRAISPPTVLALLVLLMAAPLNPLARHWLELLGKNILTSPTPGFLIAFAVFTALSHAAGLLMVRQTRCGETLPGPVLPAVKDILPDRYREESAPFPSPASALFWHEMRLSGLFLPKMTVLFGVLYFFGRLVSVYILEMDSPETLPLTTSPRFGIAHLFIFMPLFGLLAAALVWNLRTAWRNRPRRVRRADFDMRLPAPRAALARARLAAALANLAVAVGLAWALYAGWLLFADGMLVPKLMAEVHAAGGAGLRDIALVFIGPALLAAAAAWLIMHLPTRSVLVLLVLVLMFLLAGIYLEHAYSFWVIRQIYMHEAMRWLKGYGLRLALILPFLLMAGFSLTGLWLGVLTKRAILGVGMLWLGLTALIYPYESAPFDGQISGSVLASLFMAALLMLPWPALVVMLGRESFFARMQRENPEQHLRFHRLQPSSARRKKAVLLLTIIALLAWLRWPAEPAWQAAYRAQGLPASLEELNASYAHVPRERNLARRYVDAIRQTRRHESAWLDTQENYENLLIQGEAALGRTDPVPEIVMNTTREYWDKFGAPAAASLHEAAQSGLTESRYPINMELGAETTLDHLAGLRHLSRILALESWVAAVDGKGKEAATALLDMHPIANSLAAEPLFISQLVRVAILGISASHLENVLNRIELHETDLARLQQGYLQALPAPEKGYFVYPASFGESLFHLSLLNLSTYKADLPALFLMGEYTGRGDYNVPESLILELSGIIPANRIAAYQYHKKLLETLKGPVKNDADDVVAVPRTIPDSSVMKTLAAMSYKLVFSQIENIYLAELRIRTQMGMAQTALAVERFRLANGRLPGELGELVPEWIEKAPVDPWNNGKPVTYRVRDDGEYVIYSYGYNERDDGGEEIENGWRSNGDMTFTVAPPEMRRTVVVRAETP